MIVQKISKEFHAALLKDSKLAQNVLQETAAIVSGHDDPAVEFAIVFTHLPSVKWLILAILMVMFSLQTVNAQDAPLLETTVVKKSTVVVTESRIADTATLSPREDGRVNVFVSNLDDFSTFIATIDVPYESAIVRAFKKNGGYNPVLAQKSPTVPGQYIFDTPGTWTVEVFGTLEGVITVDLLEDVVIPMGRTQDVDPDVPVDPIPDSSDMQSLTDLTVATLTSVNDKATAQAYYDTVSNLEFTGDLQLMITKVTDVRKRFLVGPVNGPWYKFFQMIDDEFSDVQTMEQYKQHWDAVLSGMKKYLGVSDQALSVVQPFPANPTIGQTHNGWTYKQCRDAHGIVTIGWCQQ